MSVEGPTDKPSDEDVLTALTDDAVDELLELGADSATSAMAADKTLETAIVSRAGTLHGTGAAGTPLGAAAAGTPLHGTPVAGTPTHGSPTAAVQGALTCPVCAGPVDVKSRHVAVYGAAIRVYCSAECLALRDALPADAATVALQTPAKRRGWLWLAALALLGGAGVGAYLLLRPPAEYAAPSSPALAVTQQAQEPQPGLAADPQQEAEAMVMDELMHDAWIHPLAGPTRRMPHNHNGAFGAERAGDRPPECVSGHCGVDVGNVWGERVYAVHDGVVDFVNRGPNEEAGGIFVRISHRGGTLFSWYFHLAAVPRWIRPGLTVTAGQLIGLLGDTGVKHSEPHLHFALSVKTSKHDRERYLDPEPLIAIWPLWIPNDTGTGGSLSTAEPGLPVRQNGGSRRTASSSKRADKAKTSAPAQGGETSAGGSEPAPATAAAPPVTTPSESSAAPATSPN